ncbi:MAG: ADOP family duplicated permease [Vicinamibacterales bacterium]
MNDLTYAWRLLRKSPGFAATAILTLAVAIGANVAVFALIDAVLLKPLPYPQPDRLRLLERTYARDGVALGGDTAHAGATWFAIDEGATTVEAAPFSGMRGTVNLLVGDQALAITQQRVGAGYFGVLGVSPALGREFSRDEDRPEGPKVVILGDRLWRAVFNADPRALGQDILLRGEPHTVVGVMPASYHDEPDADLWTPLRPSTSGEGGGQNYGILLRLKAGVTWRQASVELAALADPTLARRVSASGTTLTHAAVGLQEGATAAARRPLLLLWGAVGLVLVVAAVNLAGLLLARAGRRTTEIATRLAIGGNRAAVVRQFLVESAVIATAGGLIGLVLGAIGIEGLQAMADRMVGPGRAAVLDIRVVSVAALLTALSALAIGIVPALQAGRLDLLPALAAGGTRAIAGGARGWSRRMLVVVEVALGVVLLVSTGLLARTFLHLNDLDPGLDTTNVAAVAVSLDDARYGEHDRVLRLFDEGLSRLRRLPGVESAAVSLGLPYERILNLAARPIGPGGGEGDMLFTSAAYVTPGYFETLRIPLRAGRTIDERDTGAGAAVAVVNETFARRYFGDESAVGRQIAISGEVREIVGVVGDVRQLGGFNGFGPVDALPTTFIPAAQFPAGAMRLVHTWFTPDWVVRGTTAQAVSEPTLRRALAPVAPDLPIARVQTLDAVRADAVAEQRLLATLVGLLAGAALLLAALGIHGLIASGVIERTRELGIRLALGATVGEAVRSAAWPGIQMALVGLATGLAAALGAARLLRSVLWGVSEDDPLTFVVVALVLLLVAMAASLLPALRVRRVDPVALLRE